MAKLLNLRSYATRRTPGKINKTGGLLCVMEDLKEIPFKIKRIFYIYNASRGTRGGHRHKKTRQVLICLHGAFEIYLQDNKKEETFILNNPEQYLLIEPADWHTMKPIKKHSVLLVVASEYYSEDDYIDEKYNAQKHTS